MSRRVSCATSASGWPDPGAKLVDGPGVYASRQQSLSQHHPKRVACSGRDRGPVRRPPGSANAGSTRGRQRLGRGLSLSQLMDDARRAYEEHLYGPRGRGALADAPDAGAAGGAACGDLIRVAVRVADGVVAEAGFDASGCGAVVAAGCAVVELVEGRDFLDACRVGPNDIDQEVGGLLPSKAHAATLAADALHRALGAAAKHSLPLARNSCGSRGSSARRTLVAMSGGVDSAVAAQLALDAGDGVVAVTLELWSEPDGDGTKSCCSPQAVTGARALAHRMGIPHITLDLRDEFRRQVVEDFVAEYEAGRTPNPCVRCNGLVRFGEMLQLAEALHADRLATGHYARTTRDDHGPLLQNGLDPKKDQAYMLARLTPKNLDQLWF